MDVVYTGFGSNRGDREANIISALQRLISVPFVHYLDVSSLYESEPVDGVGGGLFLNGVIKISTSLEPDEFLMHLQSIESRLGRGAERRAGPRTIDLDIILFGSRIVHHSLLIIPHPKMTQRSFVLQPLAELDPTLNHPLEHRSVTDLLAQLENPTAVTVYKQMTRFSSPKGRDPNEGYSRNGSNHT